MAIKFLTIGSDPEVFIYNRETEKYVSSENLIPGSKHNPHPFSDNGHMMQVDNVMLEFCIPPVTDKETLERELNYSLEYLNNYVKSIDPNYELHTIPSASFSEEDLSTDHAKTFGCDPDYNVWQKSENKPPKGIEGVRCAGGHVHIGYETDLKSEEAVELVKYLDLTLAIPMVIMDPDNRRKQVYGTAGRFRFKPYGLEYRTLSNYWLSSPELIHFVFDGVQKAIELFNNKIVIEENLPKIIDNIDTESALEIIKKYNLNILTKNAESRTKIKELSKQTT